MKRLKVGVIGLGVGAEHIAAYQSHSGCEVDFLCDFLDDKISEFGAKYPQIKRTKDADNILNNPAIDVVSIASFDDYHFAQTVKALRNKKHVFVEKPLCLYPAEAAAIKKLLEENPSLKLSSNLNLRTCPRFKKLRTAIQSGEMGEVFYFEGDYLWGRIHKLTNGWRKDIPFYSIVYGAAVHMIDLLIWLVGTEPIEVLGYENQIATRGSELRYNDFACLLLKFDNGMIAKITANGGCVHPHFHKVIVYGTRQTFVHDLMDARMVRSRDPRDTPEFIQDDYPGREQGDIIHSFVNSIIHADTEAIVPAEDVFKAMSICFAAEEAIRRRKPVVIDYI